MGFEIEVHEINLTTFTYLYNIDNMKHLNKLASVFCVAAMGLTALTGCEGSELFSINGPDWISEKADSIANANKGQAPTISPINLGAADNSDAFWASHLDQDIKVPSNKIYTVGFTNYSSGANNWNNYYVVLRSADKATEYAVLRSDDYGWGDGYAQCTHSNTGSADWTSWLAAMNGAHVTVAVTNNGDNTADVVATVEGTDGKTYVQTYSGIGVESGDLYLDFTTDGNHYAFDKAEVDVADAVDQQPASMELINVPEEVDKNSTLAEATADIKGKVTYSGGAVKEIAASDLTFMLVPGTGLNADGKLDQVGEYYVVATTNKTMFGKAAEKSVSASAKINVVAGIKSIMVTKAPTHAKYYFYNSAALDGVEHTLAFDPTGMEVTATYVEGEPGVVDNSKLTFSAIPATAGTHKVTITTENGKTAEVEVTVAESAVKAVTPSPVSLGAEDCSTAWWSVFTEDMKVPAGETYEFNFTNYSSMAGNWNNYVVILRNAALGEYAIVRADNYGWGNGYAACTAIGTQGDWATWLATMNGAKVKLYVTNCNNGTADIQAIVTGNDGSVTNQSYLGINTIDPSDLNVAFTVDSSHLKFDSAASARKHNTRARR